MIERGCGNHRVIGELGFVRHLAVSALCETKLIWKGNKLGNLEGERHRREMA